MKKEQGEHMASKIKAISFLECSALTGFNVQKIFDQVIESAINPKMKRSNSGAKCVIS